MGARSINVNGAEIRAVFFCAHGAKHRGNLAMETPTATAGLFRWRCVN